jgi:hypothetical protein
VKSGLKRKWPKHLSVRSLRIDGSLTDNDVENLSSIKCELGLNLDSIAAEHMYQLLESGIGQHLKNLTIVDFVHFKGRRRGVEFDNTGIILERILAACPKLEHFVLDIIRPLVQDNKYDLPPSAFKNYKR